MKTHVWTVFFACVVFATGCDEQSSGQVVETQVDQTHAETSPDADDVSSADQLQDLPNDQSQDLPDVTTEELDGSLPEQLDSIETVEDLVDTDVIGPIGTSCVPAVGDYGDCATALGWAPDGQLCRPVSGCGCGEDCDSFYQSETSCVEACVCDKSKLVGGGIGGPPVLDAYCDELTVCTSVDGAAALKALLPSAECSPPTDADCVVSCMIGRRQMIDPATRTLLCELSVELAQSVTCWVWGP